MAIFFLFKLYSKCHAIWNQQRRENLNLILIHDSVNFIHILAWEPSAAKVSKVTPAIYSHFNDFTVIKLNLESQN